MQIDFSTVDGNVEFVQLYSDVTSFNSAFVSDKINNNSDNFRIKCLSFYKMSAILCVLYNNTNICSFQKSLNFPIPTRINCFYLLRIKLNFSFKRDFKQSYYLYLSRHFPCVQFFYKNNFQ